MKMTFKTLAAMCAMTLGLTGCTNDSGSSSGEIRRAYGPLSAGTWHHQKVRVVGKIFAVSENGFIVSVIRTEL